MLSKQLKIRQQTFDNKIKHVANLKLQEIDKLLTKNYLAEKLIHDLKTPITTLLLKTYGTQFYSQVNNLQNLLAQYERDKTELEETIHSNFKTLSVDKIIKDCLKNLETQTEGFTIKTRLEKCYFNCEETELKRVFTNLLTNSIKATKNSRQKVILVTLKKSCGGKSLVGECVIKIQDSGHGFVNKNVSLLFEPKVSGSNSEGLGLYICKYLIENKFSGSITATSGDTSELFPNVMLTTFTVRLPLKYNGLSEEGWQSGNAAAC